MVLGLARRIVRDHQLAEDVFQATFLILAGEHGRGPRSPITATGCKVAIASRFALREITSAHRAMAGLHCRGDIDRSLGRVECRELLNIFDEELSRLPEKYRLPLTSLPFRGVDPGNKPPASGCWRRSEVKGMLERSLVCLRTRLAKRGLNGDFGSVGMLLLNQPTVPVASLLMQSTCRQP